MKKFLLSALGAIALILGLAVPANAVSTGYAGINCAPGSSCTIPYNDGGTLTARTSGVMWSGSFSSYLNAHTGVWINVCANWKAVSGSNALHVYSPGLWAVDIPLRTSAQGYFLYCVNVYNTPGSHSSVYMYATGGSSPTVNVKTLQIDIV